MDFKRLRVNHYIRAREVRVIDENGKQLGIMPTYVALKKAQELGMDLVEVAPHTNPPVCKIMDYSKFKYLQEKREKEIRKHKRMAEMKEIHMRPSISDHDLQTKLEHVKEFLNHGHRTKIVIRFMGREREFIQENSQKLVEKIRQELYEVGTLEMPHIDENKVVLMVQPKKRP